MVADVVDAVVGGDTHSDTHALEMLTATGVVLATVIIDNDEAGYAEALRWIAEHCPGPRLLIGLEGTRSYGIGLSRAVQAAGLPVVEVERPRRAERRRGKSDPIDAHLAALRCCGWTPTGCRCPARTVTGRRYGSCSPPGGR
jgi:transposase